MIKKFNKTYKFKIIHNVLNGTLNSGKVFLDQKILYKLFVGQTNVYHAKVALNGTIRCGKELQKI